MFAVAPVYSYSLNHFAARTILCINDEFDSASPSRTVTNAIGDILKEIKTEIGLIPELVIYKDTDGYWDRVLVRLDGSFIRFSPIVPGLESRPTIEHNAIQLLVTSTLNKLQS